MPKGKPRLPKRVYCAVKEDDSQVLGTDTNKSELHDRVNAQIPAGSFKIHTYIHESEVLKQRLKESMGG